MMINALFGNEFIHDVTASLSAKSSPDGCGYKPSRIICAINIINKAVINAVSIPNICLNVLWDFIILL